METILCSLTTKVKNHDFACFPRHWGWGGVVWINHKRSLRMPINLRPKFVVTDSILLNKMG